MQFNQQWLRVEFYCFRYLFANWGRKKKQANISNEIISTFWCKYFWEALRQFKTRLGGTKTQKEALLESIYVFNSVRLPGRFPNNRPLLIWNFATSCTSIDGCQPQLPLFGKK